MSASVEHHSRGPAGTRAVAERLGAALRGGEFVGLCGDLGAGKTAFVQGAAAGLGVPGEVYVNSPTFTLINEYEGRLRVHHVDLYRLDDPYELLNIGYDELQGPGAALFVEWCDRFEEATPASYLRVVLETRGALSRRIRIEAVGDEPRYAALVDALR